MSARRTISNARIQGLPVTMLTKRKTSCLLASLCLSPLAAMAQTPPTAGQILQQAAPPPPMPANTAPRTVVEEIAPAQSGNGEYVPVSGIRFSGNRVFDDTVLQSLVAGAFLPRMQMEELEALALRVTRHYRENGYLVARAWLPPQDISGGIVTIAVLEGQLGQVRLNDTAGVAGNATAPLRRLRSGDTVNGPAFESTLLELADLPGVEVRSTLRPGASVGTSDFLVDILPSAAVTGSVDLDNYGNRYIGAERLGTSLYWNNPAHLGDQVSLRVQGGLDDYRYGRLGYQLPFGRHATRIGAAWSVMRYELGKDFASLDAGGRAEVGSLYLQQPLMRSRRANWSATLQYDDKLLQDDIGATRTRGRKKLRNGTLGISGVFFDGLGAGASNSLALNYTRGQLGLDDTSALIDRLTARSRGDFGKWSLSYQRQQRLPGNWLLAFAGNAQWADRNLDSSEKMLLGGAGGVRAYPQGEASGDSGYMVNLELRHAVAERLEVFGFHDQGRVRLNHSRWDSKGRNHRRLAGYGIGATYVLAPFSIQAFAAWKDGTGAPESDKDRSPRLWTQLVYQFR
ncbi:ShlB/FhaC/HecB family hemolysin secretion/activation protein [Stenotrophomonas sp. CW117]|uniref:ShlB/FhaC/HecB family hemolysin secretion/activation protein n=1 Tax=Stenotrophomonas TaxID=40323 RepID=UPI000B1745A2|nr:MULTISPECIES: ShlB/FhaC/HecB family hemolysin secretion/activation protein [Stenotrophomonas]QOF98314.1 ShlB/FhaC/HecB family hemolysin secretion/activation protein [Stenotrophomonas sp. CW117]